MVNFKTLTPRELDVHRGICPLEIGRFRIINKQIEELIGPLEIFRIFSDHSVGDEIQIETLDGIATIKVFEGTDGRLYTEEQNGVRYSITKVIQEVLDLLGNSHLPTFSCRDSDIPGYKLKEVFKGIDYRSWAAGKEKILMTDSKKGVLDFNGIPDKYLEHFEDINSFYGVFLHVLENGLHDKAKGTLIHYGKDLYFRIVSEFIDGGEKFRAIFSMGD